MIDMKRLITLQTRGSGRNANDPKDLILTDVVMTNMVKGEVSGFTFGGRVKYEGIFGVVIDMEAVVSVFGFFFFVERTDSNKNDDGISGFCLHGW